MHAVDLELVRPQRLRETAPGLHLDLVSGLVARLLLAVLELGAGVAAHVLEERAAERHVEELEAAADRQDGEPSLERQPHRRQLQRVAGGRDL